MATKILIKKSVTSGSAPVSGDIDAAELAVNLADRKIYTKDNAGGIVTLDGAYVDSTAPGNPAEGDLWYDTTNNLLKAHNGSAFVSAGYQTLAALEDTTITAAVSGDFLRHNGTAWVDSVIQNGDISSGMVTQHQASLSVTESQISDLGSYITGYTVTEADVTGHAAALSVTASQVSDFDTEVGNNTAVAANTAKATNVTTNLGYTTAAAAGTVTSSDGTNATLPAATTSLAGLMTAADKVALNAAITAEADTLATVTGRGATTATAVAITNATSSTTTGTGALKVTGGVGIVENLNVGGNAIITGNLTVNGTTTSVNSNTVNIGDSIITLNSDETGTPSQDGGFEVERGTAANVSFVWNETDDAWDLNDETLQNVILDGGAY